VPLAILVRLACGQCIDEFFHRRLLCVLQLKKIFNLKISVALELSPVFVAGDQCYLFDWQSCFEQTARSLVAQIVEVQVFDLEFIACPPAVAVLATILSKAKQDGEDLLG
jgi:hypothetical protein